MIMADPRNDVQLAVIAGICGTIGSTFGKLCGGVVAESIIDIFSKVSLLVLMIAVNTAGCACFVKALGNGDSSLPATVASSSTNYFCSAIVGFLAFGESTSFIWWTGTSLVLCGLLLICYTTGADRTPRTKRD